MELIIENPIDMHLHFRDANMLKLVAPLSAKTFSAGFIMPNLVPPVDSLSALLAYRERILSACEGKDFTPLMSLFFKNYSRAELEEARPFISGIKLYPAGATTNSEGGVKAIEQAEPTLKLMEELNIPLMVHGESHGFVMDRECEFLAVYRTLAEKFPKLKITMEHITTAKAVKLLDEFENLHATITLQHLIITLDDVAGGLLQPHLFCKPIAKRPEDRDALLKAAISAHPKIMFGSDSAPHPKEKKEACGCAAGCFTAPVAMAWLAQIFAQNNALDKLPDFVSNNAKRIHNIQLPQKRILLKEGKTQIPQIYSGFGETVVPMGAGQTLNWEAHELDCPRA